MSEFWAYFKLGFDHITDPGGYDHILFVIALCAIYSFKDWKRVMILITAFTLGHSVTLALATLKILVLPSDSIELLIPVTILITACMNMAQAEPRARLFRVQKKPSLNRYLAALVFGLIHGLGFSNYLRALLGKEESIVEPLLAFNLGLEAGQVLIVLCLLLLIVAVVDFFKVPRRNWNLVVSGIIAGMALSLILNNELFRSWF